MTLSQIEKARRTTVRRFQNDHRFNTLHVHTRIERMNWSPHVKYNMKVYADERRQRYILEQKIDEDGWRIPPNKRGIPKPGNKRWTPPRQEYAAGITKPAPSGDGKTGWDDLEWD